MEFMGQNSCETNAKCVLLEEELNGFADVVSEETLAKWVSGVTALSTVQLTVARKRIELLCRVIPVLKAGDGAQMWRVTKAIVFNTDATRAERVYALKAYFGIGRPWPVPFPR